MMTSRERVCRALNFQPTDRLPKDLGGMLSTGISAFAYPKLVAALGLPPRLPKIYDSSQMLALPEVDVLDALGCDVITICNGMTNAFDQPDLWRDYDFGGRLPACVRNPDAFRTEPDGTILQGNARMVTSSYVFDEIHGGQALILEGDLPKVDLKKMKADLNATELRDDQIRSLRNLCHRVRGATDRAVFFNEMALIPHMAIHAHGGLAVFPVLCLEEPDYVRELHELVTSWALRNIRALLPEIRDCIDIIWTAGDDWGTQTNLIASPQIFLDLFLPYRKRVNDECHRLAPKVKTFLHSCGDIYTLIELVIESGFDVLNPVQWCAGQHSYRDWKEKARGRLALWGGGVNSQVTLPLGSLADIEHEVTEATTCLGQDGGYVFCNIHNLLAEILPDKVIALYRAAATVPRHTTCD